MKYTGLVIVLLTFLSCSDNAPQRDSNLSQVLQQKLPIGSSREMVESFLHSMDGVEFSFIEEDNLILAIFRDPRSFAPIRRDFQVSFQFSPSDKLERVQVKKILTGP